MQLGTVIIPKIIKIDTEIENTWILDVCDSSPCDNGGTCTVDELGMGTCECPLGYQGLYCEDSKYNKLVMVLMLQILIQR